MANPVFLVAYLAVAAVGAALLACGTAYAKASIVLTAIRNGVGLQELLPPVALHAIALVVALSVTAPVADAVRARAVPLWSGTAETPALCSPDLALQATPTIMTWAMSPATAFCSVEFTLAPWREFLERNTDDSNGERAARMTEHIPSPFVRAWVGFVFTELQEAMLLAILLLLPFFAVDAAAACLADFAGLSNVLATRAATTAKVMLLAGCGAWAALGEGLIGGYA